jgi:signal transduction histidine kinase
MRERVEVLGGKFTRDGRRGTTLTVILPISSRAESAEVRTA